MTRRGWSGRLGGLAFFVVLAILVPHQVETAKKFSEWSTPVNLGPVVNSAFEEVLPVISKDELSLYFTTSNRPGPFGGEDLWVSRRATRDDAWGEPLNLGPNINTSFNERSPALSRDGHLLFFATNRPGGFGAYDNWVSWRAHTRDDFGWQPPVNLGPGVNGAFGDFGATFFENDDIGIPNLFFASNRPDFGDIDIYRSELLANGSFGPALLIPELSSPQNDFHPTIRPDGLEVFFDSNRPGPPGVIGIGLRDLWVSTRETPSDTWSTPVNLGSGVNTEFNDTLPALSSDGMTLIFASDRPGGFGGSDLYMTSRAKHD
jgi:hypothetical protein